MKHALMLSVALVMAPFVLTGIVLQFVRMGFEIGQDMIVDVLSKLFEK